MARTDCKPLPPLSEKDIARFWSHVDKRGPDECWPWTKGRFTSGYGSFYAGKHGALSANRVALFLATGDDPFPFLACHTCDWPPCCNGRHLFKGTASDNTRDAVSKGRWNPPSGDTHPWRTRPTLVRRGSKHGHAKLTEEQVLELREKRASGWLLTDLATRFGITKGAVSTIALRKQWTHI
jgi:hypothetical protein